MNAKSITTAVAALAVAGGATWYVLRSRAATEPVAMTPEPTAQVAADAEAAKLATPVPPTADAEPAAEAPVADYMPPTLKMIDHPSGPIFVDLETKTLTQQRKVLVRQGRGKLIELDMSISAKPSQTPMPMAQRGPTSAPAVDAGAAAGAGPKKQKKGSGEPQAESPPKAEDGGAAPTGGG